MRQLLLNGAGFSTIGNQVSVSIPSNIAEGYGRRSSQELLRFLRIASGSLYEFQTQIEVAINLSYLERSAFEGLHESTREIEKMLSSFISKIEAGKAP